MAVIRWHICLLPVTIPQVPGNTASSSKPVAAPLSTAASAAKPIDGIFNTTRLSESSSLKPVDTNSVGPRLGESRPYKTSDEAFSAFKPLFELVDLADQAEKAYNAEAEDDEMVVRRAVHGSLDDHALLPDANDPQS
ncbi:hypothetical protein MMC30_004322 [Trapelia coarctata]|nr:hypothetical protein [Trapelia coarctata]